MPTRCVQIAMLNESTTFPDDKFILTAEALKIATHRDFAPSWGVDCDIIPFRSEALARLKANNQEVSDLYPFAYQHHILDHSTQVGALGFHETTPTGQPVLYSFVGDDIRYGLQPSCTISHEHWEALVDPRINRTVFIQATEKSGRVYGYEVSDAVEDDGDGFEVTVPPGSVNASPENVLISDFVNDLWFIPDVPRGPKLDFCGHLTVPLTLRPGGYISYFDVPNINGWQQMNADRVPEYKLHAPPGSRRFRRALQGKGAAA